MHANSLKNLKNGKRFGFGQPTNLGGAPAGKRLSTYLQEIAEQEITIEDLNDEKTRMPVLQAVVLSLYKKAIKDGDIKAIEAVFGLFGDRAAESPRANAEYAPAFHMILQQAGVLPLTEEPNLQ